MTTSTPSGRRRGPYGPEELAAYLRLEPWQFERAETAGLLPPRDRARGWSAALVGTIDPDRIRTQVGSVPDVGAHRAAAVLSERFGVDVEAYQVPELARQGLLRVVDYYKGHSVYSGQDLEAFTDLPALTRAARDGRLVTADQAAARLGIRRVDLNHLLRTGWLTPADAVHSAWQRRSAAPAVALYRTGDLRVLAADPRIDWAAVRATPAGRRSPLACLTPPTGAGHD